MARTNVGGRDYRTIENLGYQNGVYVRIIATHDGERVVTKSHGQGNWRFRNNEEKLQPASCYIGQSNE